MTLPIVVISTFRAVLALSQVHLVELSRSGGLSITTPLNIATVRKIWFVKNAESDLSNRVSPWPLDTMSSSNVRVYRSVSCPRAQGSCQGIELEAQRFNFYVLSGVRELDSPPPVPQYLGVSGPIVLDTNSVENPMFRLLSTHMEHTSKGDTPIIYWSTIYRYSTPYLGIGEGSYK